MASEVKRDTALRRGPYRRWMNPERVLNDCGSDEVKIGVSGAIIRPTPHWGRAWAFLQLQGMKDAQAHFGDGICTEQLRLSIGAVAAGAAAGVRRLAAALSRIAGL